eukprot:gnl/TRDRNA2_/TRDRNA2_93374_c0_seq2.p1 gnl/TRDRNA2_/TRDRNA2_93374_c0~~gnl/TRDRNA2_/TRDRNA2_93374_c0_seq2.p1  ORF type:complete len:196 (-),score=39.04 gnl/TRDRNA2_/TRDRNA2_93374_c0_seq2:53-640(-)
MKLRDSSFFTGLSDAAGARSLWHHADAIGEARSMPSQLALMGPLRAESNGDPLAEAWHEARATPPSGKSTPVELLRHMNAQPPPIEAQCSCCGGTNAELYTFRVYTRSQAQERVKRYSAASIERRRRYVWMGKAPERRVFCKKTSISYISTLNDNSSDDERPTRVKDFDDEPPPLVDSESDDEAPNRRLLPQSKL